MTRIIGSIDNASHNGTLYHLVFLTNRLLVFQLMTRDDLRLKLRRTRIAYSGEGTYQGTKDAVADIAKENAQMGKEIEVDIDSKLNESKSYTEIHYSEINSAEITKGSVFRLPYVAFGLQSGEIKYNLVAKNYGGAGRLDDELYSQYLRVLNEALPRKAKE